MNSTKVQTLSPIIFLGSGGHFRSIMEIARSVPRPVHGVLLGPKSTDRSPEEDGVKILGDQADMKNFIDQEVEFLVAFGFVSGVEIRAELFEEACEIGLVPAILISPHAILATNSQVAPGSTLHPLSFLNANVVVGENCIINSGAIIEHDAVVGNHSIIAPKALLCGTAVVEESCYIGAGAIILEGRRVGAHSLVGAGAVVTEDVPPFSRVVGVPARPMKQ